jgi:hypothetical protein
VHRRGCRPELAPRRAIHLAPEVRGYGLNKPEAGLENVTMPIVVLLVVVWVGVIGSWAMDNRRTRRPDNSVASFRAHLSTLERATPGTSLGSRSATPVGGPVDVRKRRRDVLTGLLVATAASFLLLVTVGGTLITLVFLASAGSLGVYVYALRQLKLRSTERMAKVRPLVPRSDRAMPAPSLALRRVGSH